MTSAKNVCFYFLTEFTNKINAKKKWIMEQCLNVKSYEWNIPQPDNNILCVFLFQN